MRGFKILSPDQFARFIGNGEPGWRRSPFTGLPVLVTQIHHITNEDEVLRPACPSPDPRQV